jgi:hypothetical protein
MKEFDLPVNEAFQRGLNPEDRLGRGYGRGFLIEAIGLKPKSYGLRPALDLENPFAASQYDSWPFPQLAIEQDQVLLLGETTINLVDDSTDPWTVGAALSFVDFVEPDTATTLTGGGPWHFTEGMNGGIYTNGVDLLIRDNSELLIGQVRRNRVSDVAVNTVTAHKGRVIYGGFSPSSLWSSDWSALFESWLLKTPISVDYAEQEDVGEQFVFWSSIGGGDALWPFDPPDADKWLDLFERNEAGFAPMPWKGSVYRVLPLGDGVAVYGDRGIAFLRPITSPVASFGIVPLARFGIASRSAAGGNERGHAFIASDGTVYSLSPSLELSRRGYKAFMEDGLGEEFVVSFDVQEQDFLLAGYDGSDEFAYALTPEGLGNSIQIPTEIVSYHDDSYAVTTSSGDTYYLATTEILDFRVRDVKTITTVEVGAETSSGKDIEVAVDYRYEHDQSWSRSPWVLVNPLGFARIQVTATEFRFVFRTPVAANTGFQMDYANIKWQPSGRRTVRGLTSAAEAVS